jgi:hypothetical protein
VVTVQEGMNSSHLERRNFIYPNTENTCAFRFLFSISDIYSGLSVLLLIIVVFWGVSMGYHLGYKFLPFYDDLKIYTNDYEIDEDCDDECF